MKRCDKLTIERHIKYLTERIGPRLVGSPEERAVVDFIAEIFGEYGAGVTIEGFPVRRRAVTDESLAFRRSGTWHSIPCSMLGGVVGTGGRPIEGELVVVEPPMLR